MFHQLCSQREKWSKEKILYVNTSSSRFGWVHVSIKLETEVESISAHDHIHTLKLSKIEVLISIRTKSS